MGQSLAFANCIGCIFTISFSFDSVDSIDSASFWVLPWKICPWRAEDESVEAREAQQQHQGCNPWGHQL
jgi:hypothetical protein